MQLEFSFVEQESILYEIEKSRQPKWNRSQTIESVYVLGQAEPITFAPNYTAELKVYSPYVENLDIGCFVAIDKNGYAIIPNGKDSIIGVITNIDYGYPDVIVTIEKHS